MIATVNERYALVRQASVYHVPIDDPLTGEMSAAVSGMRALLASRDELDGEWARVTARAARAARALWSIPLHAQEPELGLEGARDFLSRYEGVAEQVHGEEVAGFLRTIGECIRAILERGRSPFRDELVATLSSSRARLVVMRRSASVEAVQESLEREGMPVRVLTPAMLRDQAPVELICVMGTTRQFPASLLTAPQGRRIAFLHPDWMSDVSETEGLFADEGGLKVRVHWQPTPFRGKLLDDLEHEPDWAAIAREGPAGPAGTEIVAARLLVVAGPRRVFIEDEADADVLVVEPGARPGARVRREDSRRVVVGDFVLLRNGYGTDNTRRVIADQILGDDAKRLREVQEAWKADLRRAVERHGVQEVEDDLVSRGVRTRNLRYWLSSEAIRPFSYSDFELALAYSGKAAQAPAAWSDLERIGRAHLQAGQRLRQMLEDQIEQADMEKLLRSGEMTVKLDLAGGGSLGVYRVEEVAPASLEVPAHWLRVAQPIEADLWQG